MDDEAVSLVEDIAMCFGMKPAADTRPIEVSVTFGAQNIDEYKYTRDSIVYCGLSLLVDILLDGIFCIEESIL